MTKMDLHIFMLNDWHNGDFVMLMKLVMDRIVLDVMELICHELMDYNVESSMLCENSEFEIVPDLHST